MSVSMILVTAFNGSSTATTDTIPQLDMVGNIKSNCGENIHSTDLTGFPVLYRVVLCIVSRQMYSVFHGKWYSLLVFTCTMQTLSLVENLR